MYILRMSPPTDARSSPGPWHPLRIPLFRNLLIADLVSDVGAFMQSLGAAWVMTSLTNEPLQIALIQTASALPFFLLALPAGSVGDIIDRRKLILVTEMWMLLAAVGLALATFGHVVTPWLLLLLTFAISIGDAVEAPTWRAIFPELVAKDDLSAALTLNGIEFNLARAVGPALAGFIIAIAGVGIAFVLNAISFLGVIVVIAGWKRHPRRRTAPAESLPGATVAALRYVRYSPGRARASPASWTCHPLCQRVLGVIAGHRQEPKSTIACVRFAARFLRSRSGVGRRSASAHASEVFDRGRGIHGYCGLRRRSACYGGHSPVVAPVHFPLFRGSGMDNVHVRF